MSCDFRLQISSNHPKLTTKIALHGIYGCLVSIFSDRELTFTFAISYAIVCLSVVCLAVTFVHPLVHPTQPVEIFGNVSSPFGTLAIR